jgi:hypothetical protein
LTGRVTGRSCTLFFPAKKSEYFSWEMLMNSSVYWGCLCRKVAEKKQGVYMMGEFWNIIGSFAWRKEGITIFFFLFFNYEK